MMYFPSLMVKQRIYINGTIQIKNLTGTKMYYHVARDKQSKNYLKGYISGLQLSSYCTTPINTLSPNCHYSSLTCYGPNSINCLSCQLNSQRIQSITQKICACKKKYVDIENELICKPLSEIFPQMKEVEQELNCDTLGNDVFTIEKKLMFICPGYSSFNTKKQDLIFKQFVLTRQLLKILSVHKTQSYMNIMKIFHIKLSTEWREIQNFKYNLKWKWRL
ncbi:unnamed protein product [Paramecium primaurelia]|uniref:Transmembrane protein n=1 Tax=Paramecium primaurelia TaxID=5886 RepID=A0A8S1KVG0_PARPR|nr:unnamed protein product [Paramecium primaurelia]